MSYQVLQILLQYSPSLQHHLIMTTPAFYPLKRHNYLAPLCILIISLVGYLFDQALSSTFIYQRDWVNEGEWWRLISAHFLHTNNIHFLLNASALTLLWALHGHFYTTKSYFFIFLFSALICGLGIHFYSPDLSRYVGLSGVLHGMFVWGALQEVFNKEKLGYVLLLGVLAKIGYEQVFGASDDMANLIAAKVAIDAHLWGAIGGGLATLVYRLSAKLTS